MLPKLSNRLRVTGSWASWKQKTVSRDDHDQNSSEYLFFSHDISHYRKDLSSVS